MSLVDQAVLSAAAASDHTSHFDNIPNFRDVGKTVNDYTGKRLVAENVLFRSSRPDDASHKDRKRLRDEYQVKTVMDLRTKTEHKKAAKRRTVDAAQPLHIPGLDYLEITICGRSFEMFLVRQLSWLSLLSVGTPVAQFFALLIFGFRIKALRILVTEVMVPGDLPWLGQRTMDVCGSEIAQAIREFSSASRYPVMVHCTQGKDRTGLVVFLLLLLLGVPLGAIEYDYCLSGPNLEQGREERLAEMMDIGFTANFSDSPANFIPCMYDYLEDTYGGVVKYLYSIGINDPEQGRIIDQLQG